MKKRLASLVFLVSILATGMAWAESPITVSHALAGYNEGTDSDVLNYTLTVKNSGNSSVYNLTLSLVPLFIISTDPITLYIGDIAPHTEVQVPFTLVTPMLLNESAFLGQPLFWAGTCTHGTGNVIEFPALSNEGGAL